MRGTRAGRTIGTLLGVAALGGCIGASTKGSDTSQPSELEAMCDGGPAPDGYLLSSAYVVVGPGDPCPDLQDAQLEVGGCVFLDWQGITCEFDGVDHDMVFVEDGYGGHYMFATAAPTGGSGYYQAVGPVVDLCKYVGVFFDEPTTC